MIRSIVASLCLSVSVCAFADEDPMSRLNLAEGFRADSVVLRLAPGVSTTKLADGRLAIARTNANLRALKTDELAAIAALSATRAIKIEPALRQLPKDPALTQQFRLDRYVRVVLPPTSRGTDALTAMNAFRAPALAALIETAEVEPLGGMAGEPNDLEFSKQYSMENTGQNVQGVFGKPDADVDAVEAWSLFTGEPIVIAMLDAGIDLHVELLGRILPGWNAVDGIPEATPVCSSHGTHVAGIAAASGNNLLGIAGMNWNALVLPIKVVNSCSGTETALADGIIFASNTDARIINLSVQYYTGSSVLKDAAAAAAANGALLVAASGNNNTQVAYPAKWSFCLAVGATNNVDQKWSGSNVGPQVDLAAPGADIYSLKGLLEYGYKSGTSFAVPHVSGCASLIWTINPDLAAWQVRQILMTTLDDVETPGFDELTGWGRLNAQQAVLKAIKSLDLIGDINVDGAINGQDLGLLLAEWLTDDIASDLNNDGTVDGIDLGLLIANWT